MHSAYKYGEDTMSTLRHITTVLSEQTEGLIKMLPALLLLMWLTASIGYAQVFIPRTRPNIPFRSPAFTPPPSVPSSPLLTTPLYETEPHRLNRPRIGGNGGGDLPDIPDLEIFLEERENVYGWIHHPPRILLMARVVDRQGTPIVSGRTNTVNVEATLYLNGRAIRRIVMVDNGSSGDSVKDDGIYSAVFVPPIVGTYEFRAVANFVFYRNGLAFERVSNSKGIVFHVVPVPYPQFEGVSRGSIVRGNLQATARVFLLKKPYDQVEFPMDCTMVISGDNYYREIPMKRNGSKLSADFNIPRSGVYEIKVNLSSSIKSRIFDVSTEPIVVKLEKPLSLITLVLYSVPVVAILIAVYLYYVRTTE